MDLSVERAILIAGAGLALGLLAYVVIRGPKAAAAAAVGAVGNAGVGAVEGLGSVFGIPATDAGQCRAAMAAGDAWGASFACPAGTYLKWLGAGMPSGGASGGW